MALACCAFLASTSGCRKPLQVVHGADLDSDLSHAMQTFAMMPVTNRATLAKDLGQKLVQERDALLKEHKAISVVTVIRLCGAPDAYIGDESGQLLYKVPGARTGNYLCIDYVNHAIVCAGVASIEDLP